MELRCREEGAGFRVRSTFASPWDVDSAEFGDDSLPSGTAYQKEKFHMDFQQLRVDSPLSPRETVCRPSAPFPPPI